MRQRWFGAIGLRVPEIAVEGEDIELVDESHVRIGSESYEALVLDDVADSATLRQAHGTGVPVVVRADAADQVKTALARPEVACVAIPGSARHLRDLDLTELTYG